MGNGKWEMENGKEGIDEYRDLPNERHCMRHPDEPVSPLASQGGYRDPPNIEKRCERKMLKEEMLKRVQHDNESI